MDKNGDFAEVKMSSSGAAWTLPATETIMGCQACEVTGGAYIAAEAGSAHAFALCGIRDGSTATWRHIAFGGEERFSVKMKTGAAGRVELYLDGWYRETMKVAASEDYTVFTAPVEALRGVHTVELKFFGAFGNAVLDELTFAQMKYFCTENQRKGTCYHEFQKGHFDRERFGSFDFWKDDSLLLHDDVLEETQLWKLFSAVLEGYDPLGIVEVTPLQWDAVCREARRAGGVWQEAIEEASPWADATFREHAVFTILGI